MIFLKELLPREALLCFECFPCWSFYSHILSAILNFALLALGLLSHSAFEGKIGFLVKILMLFFAPHIHTGKSGGQVQFPENDEKICFVILSSREWKEITAIRPPGQRLCAAASIVGLIESSSPLTSMRIAWKVLFAG